jgi:hypothetical protein
MYVMPRADVLVSPPAVVCCEDMDLMLMILEDLSLMAESFQVVSVAEPLEEA